MRWKPAHETHAIERVSVTFQFTQVLSDKLWSNLLRSAAREFSAKGFTAVAEAVEINLTPQLAAGDAGALGPDDVMIGPARLSARRAAGRAFQVLDGAEVREEVSLQRRSFGYSTDIYDGWDIFKRRNRELLENYLNQALQSTDVEVIKLEYWDRFLFQGQAHEAAYSSLLRTNSQFLPEFIFGVQGLFHSHIGYFAPSGSSARRLINLNVDALDTLEVADPNSPGGELRRSVGIYSMAQDILRKEVPQSSMAEFVSALDEMHTMLKGVLADVITAEAAERISLNVENPT